MAAAAVEVAGLQAPPCGSSETPLSWARPPPGTQLCPCRTTLTPYCPAHLRASVQRKAPSSVLEAIAVGAGRQSRPPAQPSTAVAACKQTSSSTSPGKQLRRRHLRWLLHRHAHRLLTSCVSSTGTAPRAAAPPAAPSRCSCNSSSSAGGAQRQRSCPLQRIWAAREAAPTHIPSSSSSAATPHLQQLSRVGAAAASSHILRQAPADSISGEHRQQFTTQQLQPHCLPPTRPPLLPT